MGYGFGGKAGGGRGVEPMGVGVQHGLNPGGVSPERGARERAPGRGHSESEDPKSDLDVVESALSCLNSIV